MPANHWCISVLFATAGGSPTVPLRQIVFDLRFESGHSLESPPGTIDARRLRHPEHSYPSILGNHANVQYYLTIEVGSACKAGQPKQMFRVIADTGSSDLWIPATNCSKCSPWMARYDIKQSCTAKGIGNEEILMYGDGTEVTGHGMLETVRIGDLAIKNQYLIQIDFMGPTNMKFDGILGLSRHYGLQDRPNKHRLKQNFMMTLFREHPEIPVQFSLFMTVEPQSKLVFGDADILRYAKDAEFHYSKGHYMKTSTEWRASVWSIGLIDTGVEVRFPNQGKMGAPALIDSGTSLIVLEPMVFKVLTKELMWRLGNCQIVPAKGIMACDCPPAHDLSRLPSLVINMIDEQDRLFPLCLSPDEYILNAGDLFPGRVVCVPTFQRGSTSGYYRMILGMTLLRSFYTNFDVANGRIGFARSKLSPLPAGAQCSVEGQPVLRRAVWLMSMVWTLFSVLFACSIMLMPKWILGGSAQVDLRTTAQTDVGESNPQS